MPQALRAAVVACDAEAMRAAVSAHGGQVLDARTPEGDSALGLAMRLKRKTDRGVRMSIRTLLALGADPNAPSRPGEEPPLVLAMLKGNKQAANGLARMLLRHAAEPNACYRGATALTFAAGRGNHEGVRLLLDAGADPNFHPGGAAQKALTPLGAALTLTWVCPEIVETLLSAGADPNAESGGRTPLTQAAFVREALLCRRLIEAGARVGARGADGETAFEMARAWGDSDLVAYLLEQEALERQRALQVGPAGAGERDCGPCL